MSPLISALIKVAIEIVRKGGPGGGGGFDSSGSMVPKNPKGGNGSRSGGAYADR